MARAAGGTAMSALWHTADGHRRPLRGERTAPNAGSGLPPEDWASDAGGGRRPPADVARELADLRARVGTPSPMPPPPPLGAYGSRHDARAWRREARRAARRGRRHHRLSGASSGRLFRDRKRARVAGVCAGLADYLGWETWAVRCAAVTGMIFMPQIVFVAYWVLYFVMDDRADTDQGLPPLSRPPIAGFERGAELKQRLRRLRNGFESAEARLRRLEGYVTSTRFKLDRELRDIDGTSAPTAPTAPTAPGSPHRS